MAAFGLTSKQTEGSAGRLWRWRAAVVTVSHIMRTVNVSSSNAPGPPGPLNQSLCLTVINGEAVEEQFGSERSDSVITVTRGHQSPRS